jgi:hypothetical protein
LVGVSILEKPILPLSTSIIVNFSSLNLKIDVYAPETIETSLFTSLSGFQSGFAD